MDLAASLSSHVTRAVRYRGTAYFHAGRVTLLKRGAEMVTAAVSGTKPYHVELTRRDRSLAVSCTCPHFERDQQACKHIWATLLAASSLGHLVSPSGEAPRWITPIATVAASGNGSGDARTAAAAAARDGAALPLAARGGAAPSALAGAGGAFASQAWRLADPVPQSPPAPPPPPTWRSHLASLDVAAAPAAGRGKRIEEVQYVIDRAASSRTGGLVIELLERGRRANGDWGKARSLKLDRGDIASRVPLEVDRQILALLGGARSHPSFYAGWMTYADALPSRAEAPEMLGPLLAPLLAATGRASLRPAPEALPGPPLTWDAGAPWQLWLAVRRGQDGSQYQVEGSWRRGDERLALDQVALTLRSGILVTADRMARLDHGGSFAWIPLLNRIHRLEVPAAEIEQLAARLLAEHDLRRLDLPPELRCEEVSETPTPRLLLHAPGSPAERWQRATAMLRYSAGDVAPDAPGQRVYRTAPDRRLVRRDREAEARAQRRLAESGFQPAGDDAAHGTLRIERRRVADVAPQLLAEGWLLEAEGRPLRAPTHPQLAVSSHIDWFELRGGVDFDGQIVALPDLLLALRRGATTIRLGDGATGLLPEEWLRRVAPLAELGQPSGDHLRFQPAQAGLLDSLLAAEPAATADRGFADARRRLAGFAGIEPAAPPPGFHGELRPYQRAGLGWLHFLREFGFGGCLADDMGLGKTVQVLALLASRRRLRKRQGLGPSLVVVPRSLIFNWIAEAARFTPALRVRNYTGTQRHRHDQPLDDCDLVLTTYGTLRRDAGRLSAIEFDYLILDEAQAIKNPASESAKAARRLKGRHRLALTGTPVENHLGDLWSLLEFLNPGITGASAILRSATGMLRDPDETTRAQLARGLRPFILRRTKEQVAPELPAKFEQTIVCELTAGQRRLYDELRQHFRSTLALRVDERGLGRSKMLVLEALLRLRQAACHPGLIDPARGGEPSAKLDFLLPQLAEVLASGHKALVFSQFTSLLAILRRHLDAQGITHAYLDGQTRDRAARVEQFQGDPACKLFLVSLKAGGLGLNLTAADYVYLLDPWWNPAVEAQAIDRAHRIGQTRQVFAYRIVAKDTVEEKILLLQQSKRQVADAIISADDTLLRRLSRDDLDLLLS
jgi:superfamily II DNA or RNA helicase